MRSLDAESLKICDVDGPSEVFCLTCSETRGESVSAKVVNEF